MIGGFGGESIHRAQHAEFVRTFAEAIRMGSMADRVGLVMEKMFV